MPPNTNFFFRKFSISSNSRKSQFVKNSLAGSLYASRLITLKNIWLPIGLPVEDGFIRAMVLTRSFSQPENVQLIQLCDGSSHFFEGDPNLSSLIRHQIRIVVGSTLNFILFDYIRNTDISGGMGCFQLKEQLESEPELISNLLQSYMNKNQYSVIPSHFYFWRFSRFQHLSGVQYLTYFPSIILGFIFDIIVAIKARRIFLEKKVIGFW